jgi:hypothetical protein
MSEYTNRRGKRVRVDEDDVVVTKQTSALKPVKRTIKLPRLPKVSLSRRFGMTLTVMAGIVLLAGIVTADSIKRDYERQTAVMKRTITDRSKQSSSNQSSALTSITQLKSALTARADCKVSGVDVVSWYGPAKTARETCQSKADAYTKLQTSLGDMETIARYLDETSSALEPALIPTASGEFAIISDYRDAWRTAVVDLTAQTAPTVLKRQHETLIAKAQAVLGAWDALNTANNAHDTDAFRAAEKTLNERYSEFRTSSDALSVLAQSTQSSITRYIALIVE